jgi:hypothetical protein
MKRSILSSITLGCKGIKAIPGKEFTRLACLFGQGLCCHLCYIALLCAFGSALPLGKHPAPYGKIILVKRLRFHRD